jgi:hypothetical protein
VRLFLYVFWFGGFEVTENERHPKDRWKPKLYHVFIVLALVVVGFFVLLRFNLKSELEKKCDAIRAAGSTNGIPSPRVPKTLPITSWKPFRTTNSGLDRNASCCP